MHENNLPVSNVRARYNLYDKYGLARSVCVENFPAYQGAVLPQLGLVLELQH